MSRKKPTPFLKEPCPTAKKRARLEAAEVTDSTLNLQTITNELGTASDKSTAIGVQLGIPRYELKKFEKDSDPLSAVVDYWLKGNKTNPVVPVSWKSIVMILQSATVGEGGLAQKIQSQYCHSSELNADPTKMRSPSANSEDKNPAVKMDLKAKKDLEYILEEELKEIMTKFANYVDSLRATVEKKRIKPELLRSFLLSLPAYTEKNEGKLTLLSAELKQQKKIVDIFDYLKTECASFLNYEIFEEIVAKYKIIDEDQEDFKYPDHLKAYVNSLTISQFIKINPLLKQYKPDDTVKLTLKCDIDLTCHLARVVDLKKFIAKILKLKPSQVHIIDIKEGCVVVEFTIPISVADAVFTSKTKFSSRQIYEIQAASIVWLECNGYRIEMNSSKVGVEADPDIITSSAGLTISGKVETKKNILIVPELINATKIFFAEALANFRECHILCVKSGLFSSKKIVDIDTCAVSFRQMCLDTVTVARVVSDQWLRSTIMFFKNISKVKEPQKMLILFGNQAKEISVLFKVIGAWARDIAGRFHEAQDDTIAEDEEFKKVFAETVKTAEEAKQQADKQTEAAEKCREAAQSHEDVWSTAQIVLPFYYPPVTGVSAVGASVAASKTAEAEKIEQAAITKLRQAEDELQKRTDAHEKAKYIASKAGDLIKLLNQVEKTCEAIATFWTMQSDKFLTQGQSLETNDAAMMEFMPEVVAEDNVKVWTEAQTELTQYADAMAVIGNCFNFVTDAKAPPAIEYIAPSLHFTLHIPSTVDTKAIEKSVDKKQITE